MSQGNRGVYLNSLRDQRQKERNDKIQFFNANKDVMLPLEREVIKGEINLLQFEIMKLNEKIKLENQRVFQFSMSPNMRIRESMRKDMLKNRLRES